MIVIKSGPEFSKIYADKAFDKWGAPTDKDIRIVEEWRGTMQTYHTMSILMNTAK